MALTVLQVEHAGKPGATLNPGKHHDGNGLYLDVEKATSKSFTSRLTIGGKEVWRAIGSAKHISLARARELNKEYHRLAAEGIDPREHRKSQQAAATAAEVKTVLFEEWAEQFIVSQETGWKNAKHRQQWRNTLTTYAYPIIGNLPLQALDTDCAEQLLKQPVDGTTFWLARPETARRVRGRCEKIWAAAKAKKLCKGDNPFDWTVLKHLLPPKSKVSKVKHHPAMPYRDVPAFMERLFQRKSVSARALEFTILTAVRTNETIGARWSEINTREALWLIPGERMKGGKEHKVPLTAAVLTILADLPRDGEYVFQRNGKPLSNMAMLKVLALAGHPDLTVHGFRSSFKDWATDWTPPKEEIIEAAKRGEIVETYPRDLVEVALAHGLDSKTEEAYRRTDMIEKRRRLMGKWAEHCGKGLPDNVVPIRRPA